MVGAVQHCGITPTYQRYWGFCCLGILKTRAEIAVTSGVTLPAICMLQVPTGYGDAHACLAPVEKHSLVSHTSRRQWALDMEMQILAFHTVQYIAVRMVKDLLESSVRLDSRNVQEKIRCKIIILDAYKFGRVARLRLSPNEEGEKWHDWPRKFGRLDGAFVTNAASYFPASVH